MGKTSSAAVLYWSGLLFAFAFASVGTWSLMEVLTTRSLPEIAGTAWNLEGPLFRIWAFAVPLGSLLAVIGALVYAKANRFFVWILAIAFPAIVVTTIMVYSTRYYPGGFYGVGGTLILLSFFALVWVWMKKYREREVQQRTAGALKLTGYLFLLTATWYLCGDTAKLHLKAFEGTSVPSPTESMVFLVLGWFFVTFGEYMGVDLRGRSGN